MKKIFIFFLLLMLSVSMSSAMEITSQFGWRIHPIFGNKRFHTGVDIGGNFGDFIPSTQEGVVSFSGWYNGYGNTVIINHPDGTQTLYAHCQDIFIQQGERVLSGQTIATVGSTGNSTGPHLHFEYNINGQVVDPVPYLSAAGWSLTYNGNFDYTRSDDDDMPWDFNAFYDIAQGIRVQLEKISDQCKEGLKLVQSEGKKLLYVLMVIDFGLTASLLSLNNNSESFAGFLVKKFLKYGFIFWLLSNWGEFVNVMILDMFTHTAVVAGGGGDDIAKEISDPSRIIQKGVFLVQPVFDFLSKNSGMHLIVNVHNVIIAIVLGLGILICYIIIGIQFFLSYLQFYIISVISVFFIPFGTVKHLKFLSEKGLGAVINVGLKLMVMIFMVSLVVYGVKDLAPPTYTHGAYLKILLASIVLTYFVSKVSDIMKLLNVSPKW